MGAASPSAMFHPKQPYCKDALRAAAYSCSRSGWCHAYLLWGSQRAGGWRFSRQGLGENLVGGVLILRVSCPIRSQRGWLPSHIIALYWSVMHPGNSWKAPGLQRQFSPLGRLMDCADVVSSSETAQTPAYLQMIMSTVLIRISHLEITLNSCYCKATAISRVTKSFKI